MGGFIEKSDFSIKIVEYNILEIIDYYNLLLFHSFQQNLLDDYFY